MVTEFVRGATFWAVAGCFVAGCLVADSAPAQPAGKFGIGGQVGPESGLSLRVVKPQGSLTALMAFNFDGFARFEAHAWTDRAIPESPLRVFVGPAVVVGSDHSRTLFGAGIVAGTFFTRNRFEVFLEFTPRFDLAPDSHLVWGSGVGLRYYP